MINKMNLNNGATNTMNYLKLSVKKLFLMVPSIGAMMVANATQFEPSTSPIFKTAHAKPNIHMMLDDSSSMKQYKDVMTSEHAFGFSLPVCEDPGSQWHEERKRLGEYDPFQDGAYKPWNDDNATDGKIGGKTKPPAILNCKMVARYDALDETVKRLMYKYKEKAYLGVSFLWQVNDHGGGFKQPPGESLLAFPITDYSGYSDAEFKTKVIDRMSKKIRQAWGETPMHPAAYEIIKMFRGQPLTQNGVNGNTVNFPTVITKCDNNHCYYPYLKFDTPLRYRCQQNHFIVMTDGEANMPRVWGVDPRDQLPHSENHSEKSPVLMQDGVNQSLRENIGAKDIGRIVGQTDLRYELKPILKNGIWEQKKVDDAGKSWTDEFSEPMPIFTHSVSLHVNPLHSDYTDMTASTGGMNLGIGHEGGSVEDLFLAFDTIFSSIIKSTSSTSSTNDRVNSNISNGNPLEFDGEADLSEIGTIRYDSTYNFNQRFGKIRAMVPYLTKDHNGESIIDVVEIWNTDQTILLNEGRYLTFLDSGSNNGTQLTYISDDKVVDQFKKIHDARKTGEKFDQNYIKWLTNAGQYDDQNQLRSRLRPLGSMTASDILLSNKDLLNINTNKDKMSSSLSSELIAYLKYKAQYQPANYLIVSDNDGFINFLNAQRGLTGGKKAGARDTAYFPQLLAHRLDEIAKENREATLVLEGKTSLTDAKVYQPTIGDIYATIGLTSMGSGGKGLVGYRIFGAPESLKVPSSDNLLNQVTPLFEITNEGPKEYRTKGFDDLGYTYSGFEFFNRVKDKGQGQAVAVFGNGFGVDKSVLYFIDAYTGEKLHEITLNNFGGGASTPAIVVRSSNDGQALDRIYVGDYSGTLYKVNFNGKDLDDDSVTVTALFQASTAPNNAGQSAITARPLVTKDKTSKLYNVAFGTGSASSQDLDRGKNSLVEHSLYNVVDHNNMSGPSTAEVAVLSKVSGSLPPLLTINDLRIGEVKYAEGSKIDYLVIDKHELDIQTPTGNSPNGWAIRLIADGTNSGERIQQRAMYDSTANAVVFVTWGIFERDFSGGNDLYDPCLSDEVFGKVLSFDVKTGKSSGKTGIYNQGSTGTAEGGLTGEGLLDDPEGNSTTELDKDLQEELVEIVGEEDSSHASDGDTGLHCVGDVFGRPECSEIEKIDEPEPLPKGRVNFRKMNAYY